MLAPYLKSFDLFLEKLSKVERETKLKKLRAQKESPSMEF